MAIFNTFSANLRRLCPVNGWNEQPVVPDKFASLDPTLRACVNKENLAFEDYARIFEYIIEGIKSYKNTECSLVFYPGVSGTRGKTVEGLEGFARTAPMLAAWLFGGREKSIQTSDKSSFDIFCYLKTGLLNGTNHNSTGYWGNMVNFDQRCVEAGDIAITFWLLCHYDEHAFNDLEKTQVIEWLLQLNNLDIYGGNWCLFKLMVNLVSNQFGRGEEKIVDACFAEFVSFHVGDGWYGDGVNGLVDYYNAWQMYYYLYWINIISPEYNAEYIRHQVSCFTHNYKYFFTPVGVPMFGRSSCYRISTSTPLIIDSAINHANYGIARRALECTWIHFIKNRSLAEGRITQGYYTDKPELLENYSGRASPMWSLRSLTIAFMMDNNHEFWRSSSSALPVEESDYSIEIPGPAFTLEGKKSSLSVKLTREHLSFCDENSYCPIEGISLFRRLMQNIFRRPFRKENLNIKYGRKYYSSDDFYCG